MPHIIFKGLTKAQDEIFEEREPLPEESRRLQLPEHMIGRSMLFGIPFFVLCFLTLVWKAGANREFPLEPLILVPGIAAGMLCCFLHELLHALPQPQGARVYIGLIPDGFIFYMKCAAPLTKRRFIFMSLLPMVLGLIPLILFIVSPVQWKALNSLMWPMAMIGLISPSPDYMTVYHILREVPAGAYIQDGGDGLYWYRPHPFSK